MVLDIENGKGEGGGVPVEFPGRSGMKGKFRIAGAVFFTVKMRCPQHGMGGAQGDEGLYVGEEVFICVKAVPVQPGDLVILTVGVIVPVLSVGKFITGQEHGNTAACE